MRPPLPAFRREFQASLLAWYRRHARSLPWREAPTLYKTVVSEFMLQQTQVKTVLPYFSRWLASLPDFDALAAAPEEQVLKLWEGLGYYSRARNLHRLARTLVALPAPPRTPEAWQELPGVGPYTAAAITSISFSAPAACVDGNVVRILTRLTADSTRHRDSATAARALAPLATALLSADHPGDHNQAMMELGATVCLRQNPLCLTCPVRTHCAAARAGNPQEYPRLAPRTTEERQVTRLWCLHRGALLLHRASAESRRLARLHELPTAAQLHLTETAATQGLLLLRRRRSITRYVITERIHALSSPPRHLDPGLVWIPLEDLDSIALSGPHRRWIREVLADTNPSEPA
ncbi:MAG: A/G-specific adenine glycosylase [Verrucomicrobia bacterium]|nr:A/G-specific adenine glycosylase [Verrucomicrobiota bacterium]